MAVYECVHNVLIAGQKYKIINVSIQKTVNSFTNNCVITLSKRLRLKNQDIFSDIESFVIKKEDVVSIQLGYIQGTNVMLNDTQFNGFVSQINILSHTVEIICEDYMFFLKKLKFSLSAQSISLNDLGNILISKTNSILPSNVSPIKLITNGIGLSITNLVLKDVNGVEVLQHLKQFYTLDSFFLNDILNIGINYGTINQNQKRFTFSTFPSSLIKTVSNQTFLKILNMDGLKYQKADDIKLQITAKVFTSNSDYYEEKFGDTTGEQRTFIFSGNPDKMQLQNLVNNQIQRYKYSGFTRGSSFVTFGLPTIQPLDIVSFDGIGMIRWYDFNAKNTNKITTYAKASYLVESVKIDFGTNGFKQTIGISLKVSVDSDNNSIAALLGNTTPI